MTYDTAKSLEEIVSKRFNQFGFPLLIEENIIPNDNTTLFVCSGMQNLKHKFANPDNTKHGTLQSCVRTDDLELVGDGSHLTFFKMLGNFSFGRNDYEISIELWDSILKDLNFSIDYVTYHPSQLKHKELWLKYGYTLKEDVDCVWSDGNIGGYCCEIYSNGLEIGNLVNTLGHSTDVGFGWERLYQIIENKSRVDETCLFRQDLDYILRDHVRTLEVFYKNGISPSGKGRGYICRSLLRKVKNTGFIFDEWIEQDRILQEKNKLLVKRMKKRHMDKPWEWWYTTFGITKEELDD